MKRIIDIVLSLIALIILSPLLIAVSVILCFTGEGLVFYRQERVGLGGRTFGLYKFVTMLKDSPNLPGGLLTKEGDPRILPIGRILRSTKINELPQFFNVLKGDMSLIGPRPQAKPHFDVFPEYVKKELIKVKPGLSGIGSILFRNEESILTNYSGDQHECYEKDIAPYKGELEIWYIKNQSLMIDIFLMLLTVWVVVFPKSRLHKRLFRDLPYTYSETLAKSLDLPLMVMNQKPKHIPTLIVVPENNGFPAKVKFHIRERQSKSNQPQKAQQNVITK